MSDQTNSEKEPKLNALQLAFLKSTKGKWSCTLCHSFSENKYNKCQACDEARPGTASTANETPQPPETTSKPFTLPGTSNSSGGLNLGPTNNPFGNWNKNQPSPSKLKFGNNNNNNNTTTPPLKLNFNTDSVSQGSPLKLNLGNNMNQPTNNPFSKNSNNNPFSSSTNNNNNNSKPTGLTFLNINATQNNNQSTPRSSNTPLSFIFNNNENNVKKPLILTENNDNDMDVEDEPSVTNKHMIGNPFNKKKKKKNNNFTLTQPTTKPPLARPPSSQKKTVLKNFTETITNPMGTPNRNNSLPFRLNNNNSDNQNNKPMFPTFPSTPKNTHLQNVVASPATQLSSLQLNPFQSKKQVARKVEPMDTDVDTPLVAGLSSCLDAAKELDGVDFIFATGQGGFGSTGLGEDDELWEVDIPTLVQLPTKRWEEMCCGAFNSGLVSHDGTAWVCGANDHGNLGCSKKTADTLFNFQMVNLGPQTRFKKMSMGDCHTVILDQDGGVWSCGTFKDDGNAGHHYNFRRKKVVKDVDEFTRIREISNLCVSHFRDKDKYLPPMVDISSGGNHFLMLDQDGKCWEMGVTTLGQRASKRNTKKYLAPRRCAFLAEKASLRFKQISCGVGGHFNLALTREGDVYAWGSNSHLQCGMRSTNEFNVIDLPTKIQFPENITVQQVVTGTHFALALDSQGRVWSWGRNASNTLGRVTPIPPKENNQTHMNEPNPDLPGLITSVSNVKKLGAGASYWFALTKAGNVYAYGANLEGVCGCGSDNLVLDCDPIFTQENLKGQFEVISMIGSAQHSLFHLRKTHVKGKRKRNETNDELIFVKNDKKQKTF